MSNKKEFDIIYNYSSLLLLEQGRKKKNALFKKKKIKSKGNAVWGDKPVCKVGINDNKNKVLFLEKNRIRYTLYEKKKCENCVYS